MVLSKTRFSVCVAVCDSTAYRLKRGAVERLSNFLLGSMCVKIVRTPVSGDFFPRTTTRKR